MWNFFFSRKYFHWSILGTIFIIYITYYKATIDIKINVWFGNFYNLIEKILKNEVHDISLYYDMLLSFGLLAGLYVFIATTTDFYIRHWVFRWRTSINDYFLENWKYIHDIEGASQRIQEDCRIFSSILESIGISFVRSVFTLSLFLPHLFILGEKIPSVSSYFSNMSYELIFIAISYALLGTIGLALVGIKLPGLQFNNQVVEARYRKHLVYCEDKPDLIENDTYNLYDDVRKNYFKIFLHYSYFDIVRWSYLQFGVLIPYLALGPSIFAGILTLGLLQEISRAFGKIESSFQFFVNSWTTIVELVSVYKRLSQFQKKIKERKRKEKRNN